MMREAVIVYNLAIKTVSHAHPYAGGTERTVYRSHWTNVTDNGDNSQIVGQSTLRNLWYK